MTVSRESTECRQCLFFNLHAHPNNNLYGSCGKGNWDKTGKREFRAETVVINENRLIVARGRDCSLYRPLAQELLERKLSHIAAHWDDYWYGDVRGYLRRLD